jgi:hypothetical protein
MYLIIWSKGYIFVQVFTINRDEKSDMVEPTRIREEHF